MSPAALALSLVLSVFAPQQAGSAPLAPAQEARVQALGKQLRCAVCQGLSVADSPASMARAQLDTVRALVSEGKSDLEIRDYFVARYGEWVLLAPPKHGLNWLVWLGPLGLLGVGGLLVAGLLRSTPRGATSGAAAPAEVAPVPATEDAFLKAVREEVDS
jgi:cytochrome c-type biogenesis protein CcmH